MDLNNLTIPEFWESEREALRPPDELSVSEWANHSIVLLPESSREPGPYRWQRTPYVKGILDLYAHPDIRQIVLKFATQTGKTTAIYAILGHIIDQDPYSTIIMYPSDDECKLISRTRVQPMLEASPPIRVRIPADRSRYQLTEMHFPGMVLYLSSGSSVTGIAQRPVRNLLRDEINKYPESIGEHGNPMDLSDERLKAFWDIRKVIDVSSPTTGQGNITLQEGKCQVILGYSVPCPHCGNLQLLEWEGIRFDDDHALEKNARIAHAKDSAHYECACGHAILDRDKDWMLSPENGAGWYDITSSPGLSSKDPIGDILEGYKARGVTLESVAFRLSSIYSPWITFGDVVEKFLQAHLADLDRFDKLRSFTNNWLAREWEDVVEVKEPSDILKLRCELDPLLVPHDAVALTAGVDCQKRGFYYTVWAWAKDGTRWLIDYGIKPTWEDIEQLVYDTAYPYENGIGSLGIWRSAFDTGGTEDEDGSMTERAYKWLAMQPSNRVFGVKGASREIPEKVKSRIIGTIPGTRKPIPGAALLLWTIDTGYFKDILHRQLQVPRGQAGCVYLHRAAGEDFASQIVSEAKRRNKQGRFKWVRIKGQNHWLDATIYAGFLVNPMCLGGLGTVPARAKKPLASAQVAEQGERNPEAVLRSRQARTPDRRSARW